MTGLSLTALLEAAVMAATPEPGEVVDTPPPELVTPGTLGFLVTFGVAVALVLLVRDMTRRERRIRVRSELADERLRNEVAEREAREAAAGADAGGGGLPGGSGERPDSGPGRRGDGRPARRAGEDPDDGSPLTRH